MIAVVCIITMFMVSWPVALVTIATATFFYSVAESHKLGNDLYNFL